MVGVHPEVATSWPPTAATGPFLSWGEETRSLDAEEKLLTISVDEALTVLAQPKQFGRRRAAPVPPLRELGPDPVSGQPVVVKDGRFGPYVTDGETNASLRKGDTVEGVTIERAAELLQIRRDAGPSKKRGAKRTAAKKAPPRRPPRRRPPEEDGREEGPAKKAATKKARTEKAATAGGTTETAAMKAAAPTVDAPTPRRGGGARSRGDRPAAPRPRRRCLRRRTGRAGACGCSGRPSSSGSGRPRSCRPPVTGSGSSRSPRSPPASGRGSPEAAVGFVMAARIVPGFFLGAASGVVADRFDRKKVMVSCDVGRACVLVALPFVDTVGGLVLASLVLEMFTLLWTPAKEASVPNLVPEDHLTTANSLSLVAAYGTVPLAAGLFAAPVEGRRRPWAASAPWTACAPARRASPSTPTPPRSSSRRSWCRRLTGIRSARRSQDRSAAAEGKRIDFAQAFREIKEGWQFIFINPVVRSVNLGLATGLIGGGMLVPLGPVFSIKVLGAGTAGFGFFIFAMGCGVAIGVVLLSVFQKRLPKARIFAYSLLLGGVSLFLAASMSSLGLAALFVLVLGMCAGSVYVLGFTLLHESVDDELRGRIFSALYTLVRLCVLIVFAVGPLMSDLLDKLSKRFVHREVSFLSVSVAVPGVRLTLWLAALIILGAGFLAVRALQAGPPQGTRWSGEELVSDLTLPITSVKHSHDHPSLRNLIPPGSLDADPPDRTGDEP